MRPIMEESQISDIREDSSRKELQSDFDDVFLNKPEVLEASFSQDPKHLKQKPKHSFMDVNDSFYQSFDHLLTSKPLKPEPKPEPKDTQKVNLSR